MSNIVQKDITAFKMCLLSITLSGVAIRMLLFGVNVTLKSRSKVTLGWAIKKVTMKFKLLMIILIPDNEPEIV